MAGGARPVFATPRHPEYPSGLIQNLRINGVDVVPLVELDVLESRRS